VKLGDQRAQGMERGEFMGRTLEDLRIYQTAEELCDAVWDHVIRWDRFAKETVGRQLVHSPESIGSNIAEGYGRYHFREDITFLYYARGSAKETGFWLRRAERRRLMPPETRRVFLEQLSGFEPQLNAYINSVRRKAMNAAGG